MINLFPLISSKLQKPKKIQIRKRYQPLTFSTFLKTFNNFLFLKYLRGYLTLYIKLYTIINCTTDFDNMTLNILFLTTLCQRGVDTDKTIRWTTH